MRGRVWHDAGLCCCLQLAGPIGLSPLTLALSLNPPPRDVLEERCGEVGGGGRFGRTPLPPMVPPTPAPKAPENVFTLKSSCAKGTEENFASNSGRGGGGGVQKGADPPPPLVVSRSNKSPASPSVGGGAHRPPTPLCPPSPYLAYPHPPTPPSFPLGGCANGAPGRSLFHCSVSDPHGGGQLPSPLARCVQVDTPDRRWGGGGASQAAWTVF